MVKNFSNIVHYRIWSRFNLFIFKKKKHLKQKNWLEGWESNFTIYRENNRKRFWYVDLWVEAVTESGVGAIQNERKYSVVWWFNYRAIFPRKWLGCFTRQCLFSQVKLQFFLRSIPMHFIFLLMLLTNWINGIFQADILVRGYGGYNTRWALFLLHHLFPLVCNQITLR
jgi:hypothetical protein